MAAVGHISHAELLTPDVEAGRDLFTRILGLREVAGTRFPQSWTTYGTPPLQLEETLA